MSLAPLTSRSLVTQAIAATAAVVTLGCGRPNQAPAPAASAATQTQERADIASADPQTQYFHEQLVDNGEDLQSDFGGYLLTLGMNPRDLQQDDPKHAYDTVLEKVRQVEDVSLRRDMMRTFFNSSTDPR